MQKSIEGGGWHLTRKKNDLENLEQFGRVTPPKLLQEWCDGKQLKGAKIGIISGLRTIGEMQKTSNLQLFHMKPQEKKRENQNQKMKRQKK